MSARREHPLFLFDNRTVEKAQVPLVHPLHIRYSFLETDGQPDVTDIARILRAPDVRHEDEAVIHYHLGVEHFDPKSHTFTPWRMSDIAHFEGTSWCSRDDGNGHLYVGHDGQGMSLIDLKQRTCRSFTHQDDPHSLPGNIVHCIFIDRDHRVWVGTNNGLALFHPEQGTFTTFRHEEGNPHSLLSNYVYDIG